ncbi:MAG: hypothetical protein V2J10_07045 [Wenzhouxiangella sp.]|jgi:hypothetical protein|nr:hypothetical protein [Wenzhouxiangella sp.]
MLLRRVIEHVKTQNWTAVALDFLIVVVGVFIGIQVSNWNEVRSERVAAVSFEQRLGDDLRNQIKEYDAMIDYYESVRGSASRTLQRLDAGPVLDDEGFLIDAYRATQYIALIPLRSTYDELKASGGLRLIDPVLLRAVSGTFEINEVGERSARFLDAPYRLNFRQSIDPEIQKMLAQACGDNFEVANAAAGGFGEIQAFPSISYDCTLDVEPVRLRTAAETLLGNESIAPALRFQIVEYDAYIATIQAQRNFVETGLANWLDQAGR